jgi:DNA-binding NarL/FixJ family response regulator
VKKTIFIFSALVIALLILFRLSKYSVLSGGIQIEMALAGIALLFFFIGLHLNKKNSKRDPSLVDSGNYAIDRKKIEALGLSDREYEILVEISKGLSNKEIADTLFVSESTVKTHVSNVFVKLNAKRRTQAIKMAKEMQIIP